MIALATATAGRGSKKCCLRKSVGFCSWILTRLSGMAINAGGARSCTARQPPSVARPRRDQRAAHRGRSSVKAHATSFNPVSDSAAAFAPATVANLGPGFDWMGCAVEYEGDTVIARVLPDAEPGTVVIESIHGDGGKLPLKADANCVGIAAKATMKMFPGECSVGVGLTLKKGLPLGSGLGSSAASAAAGAWAVNSLFGCPITKDQLVLAGLEAEATVSGYHADNIAPALLGGFILIRSADPLDIQQLAFPENAPLYFVLVNPKFEAPTKEMRAALPSTVPFSSMITNSVMGGSLVAAILAGDVELLGRSLDRESVVEPARSKLIPGFQAVKAAAKEEGAFGCTISGAGPTAVAVVADRERGEAVAAAMMAAFRTEGKLEINAHAISTLDTQGAVSLPCL